MSICKWSGTGVAIAKRRRRRDRKLQEAIEISIERNAAVTVQKTTSTNLFHFPVAQELFC